MLDNSFVFVLVEPQYRGNIGAAARVMHNFGFKQLRLVGSVPQNEDYYLAMHSEELLQRAVTFDSLSDAIEDCELAIALTRRFGRKRKKDIEVTDIGNFVKQLPRKKIALVFGREANGLTEEEVELCHIRCEIRSNPDFASLNLAQAVAIVSYELFNSNFEQHKESWVASDKMVIESCNHIIAKLDAINYFDNGDPEVVRDKLQNLLHKSYSDTENLVFLTKLFDRIEILLNKKQINN